VKIKLKCEESDDPQNYPTFTSDILSTVLEKWGKAVNASFSEMSASSIKKM
jgi:hypothetical protein